MVLQDAQYSSAEGPQGSAGSATGQLAFTMLEGGVIGSGIGMLLVDSLDKKMPWKIKM